MSAFWGGQPSYDFEEDDRCEDCGAWLSKETFMVDNEYGEDFEDYILVCKNPRCPTNKHRKRIQ